MQSHGELKFSVNASFWIFLGGAVVLRMGYLAAMYTIAVVLHETAHYLVAKRLFYLCREIRVGIFGAVLYGDFGDVAGADRIKIALAGPVCNFVMCLLCLAVWWILPESYFFLESFFSANLSMGCVNLLPCYPLDGGRVLTGVLDGKVTNSLRVTQLCTYVCSFLCFLIFFVSLFSGQNLFHLGLFAVGLFSGVVAKGGGECYVRTAFLQSEKFLKHGMEKKILVFDQNSRLSDVAKRMRGNCLYCLEVVNSDMTTLRRFDVAELEQAVVTLPSDTLLKDLN